MYILKDKMNDLSQFLRLQSYDTKLTNYEIYQYVKLNHGDVGDIDTIRVTDKYLKVGYDEDKLIIEIEVDYNYLNEDY